MITMLMNCIISSNLWAMGKLPRIAEAPLHRRGYYEARPVDVAGRNDLLFIDIRDEKDLSADLGHIHNIHHLPESDVLDGLRVPNDRALVIVCNNGRMSGDVAEKLVREQGFVEVYQLVGGMIRWLAEERPVARVPTWRHLYQ